VPTASAGSRAERIEILDGDLRAFAATRVAASVPTRGWVGSRGLLAQGPTSDFELPGKAGVRVDTRHGAMKGLPPRSPGVSRWAYTCLALQVESCSPRAPSSRAPQRVGRLRALGRGSGRRASSTSLLLLPDHSAGFGQAIAKPLPGVSAATSSPPCLARAHLEGRTCSPEPSRRRASPAPDRSASGPGRCDVGVGGARELHLARPSTPTTKRSVLPAPRCRRRSSLRPATRPPRPSRPPGASRA
jgi:hypothetical protein